MTFREVSVGEFKKFTLECETVNYMQSVPMYQRYQKIGREAYLLGAFKGKELVVSGLVSVIYERMGRKIFTFSRGPLVRHDSIAELDYFLSEAKQFLRHQHGIVLQISPPFLAPDAPADFKKHLATLGFKYLGEYEQVKWIYALDFTKIADLPPVKPRHRSDKAPDMLSTEIAPEVAKAFEKHFHKNHKYTIRYATDRYGLALRVLLPSEYNILTDLMRESGKVHGFAPREQKFYEQMAEAFKDKVAAVVAEMPGGIPTAVGFFILYGDEVIYLSSGMSREFKKYGGPHLIQWAAINYAYKNGYRKYNFWGTHPDPASGVFKFKQGFNGEVEEFVGTFAAPLSLLGRLYLAKLHPAEQRNL